MRLKKAEGEGASSQGAAGAVVLRGWGAAAEKSAALWFESAQPSAARRAAVVLDAAGAGELPSEQLAVEP